MIGILDTLPNPRGILSIHAAAVEVQGSAVVFLGHSGAGKSTICHLLESESQLLADDRIHLVPECGKWGVAPGGPWVLSRALCKSEADRLEAKPLRAFLRVYQAPKPRLDRLDEIEAGRCLVDAFFEILRNQYIAVGTKKAAFSGLASVARTVPGYRVDFDLSSQTVEMFRCEFGF